MAKIEGISAAILAGGKATRMLGQDKARLIIGGKPILERIFSVLKNIFPELLIVTSARIDYSYSGVKVVRDTIEGAGPLGGMHAALSAASNDAVFFTACDMPFLDSFFILRQLKDFQRYHCDCLVPRIGKHVEPLHAIYRKRLKDDISAFLMNNDSRSVRIFLKTVNVNYMDLDNKRYSRKMFMNVNSSRDLEEIKNSY